MARFGCLEGFGVVAGLDLGGMTGFGLGGMTGVDLDGNTRRPLYSVVNEVAGQKVDIILCVHG